MNQKGKEFSKPGIKRDINFANQGSKGEIIYETSNQNGKEFR